MARRPLPAETSSGTPLETGGGLRIVIVAEHALVAEAVRAALTGRGYAAVVVGARQVSVRTDQAGWRTEVGILLTHHTDHHSPATRVSMERTTIPWLVLASEERCAAWGAYYASGATLVVPPSTGLDEVCRLLRDLAADRPPSVPRGRRKLIRAWRETLLERDELNDRLSSLTTREHQVLQQLHEGIGVRSIAQGSEVAEATVRTQVKAILKKLQVSSQIAAVAAYTQVQGDVTTRRSRRGSPTAMH